MVDLRDVPRAISEPAILARSSTAPLRFLWLPGAYHARPKYTFTYPCGFIIPPCYQSGLWDARRRHIYENATSHTKPNPLNCVFTSRP